MKQTQDIEQLLQQKDEVVVAAPAWYTQLKEAVGHLIDKDFDALLQLLYRVDVSEEKLRRLLHEFPAADAAGIITNLLLERQLQKIKSRRDHAQRDESIPDDERW
jgi:predicted translin family RNA/ssDNA-binding protein